MKKLQEDLLKLYTDCLINGIGFLEISPEATQEMFENMIESIKKEKNKDSFFVCASE